MTGEIRKIIHVDMDAFFAAVEQRDNPELRGKPVIVGGPPDSRGVVSTASYEARPFGVHSAMASSVAYRKCPNCIFVKPRFEAYKEASEIVMSIFHEYTDLVQPMSLDEAYLDVTQNKMNIPYATEIARQIKARIKARTKLTASAGVSFNKFLAKVGSDFNKPDGLTVITPAKAMKFIESLDIRKFPGVGKVTEKRMKGYGIYTGKDLKKYSQEELIALFGKSGRYYFNIVRGIDKRRVTPDRGERGQVGKERTFQKDIDDIDFMHRMIRDLAHKVSERMRQKNYKAKTVTLKVKYFDFNQITRSRTVNFAFDDWETIFKIAASLLENTDAGDIKIRLLGVTCSNLIDMDVNSVESIQLYLPFEF
ncbi:MAG: DNA polymerase IV [Candidatus Zixiibacteriota bacterium]